MNYKDLWGKIIVQKGDNLIKLARKYQTTPDAIMRDNPHLKSTTLIAGQELNIGEDAYIESITPSIVTSKKSNKDFAKLQPQTQNNISYYRQELNSGRITWDQIPDIYKQHIVAMDITDNPAKMQVVKGIGAVAGGLILADKLAISAATGTLGPAMISLVKGLFAGYAGQKAVAYGVDAVSGRNEYDFPKDLMNYTPVVGTNYASKNPTVAVAVDMAASTVPGFLSVIPKNIGNVTKYGQQLTGSSDPIKNYVRGIEGTTNKPAGIPSKLTPKQIESLGGGNPKRPVIKTKIDGKPVKALYNEKGELTGVYTNKSLKSDILNEYNTFQYSNPVNGEVPYVIKPARGINRSGYTGGYTDLHRGKVLGQYVNNNIVVGDYKKFLPPAMPGWSFFPFNVEPINTKYVVNGDPKHITETVPWNPWMNPDYVGEQAPYVSGGDVSYVMKAPIGSTIEEQPILEETVVVTPGYQNRQSIYEYGSVDGTPTKWHSGLGFTYLPGIHNKSLIYKK